MQITASTEAQSNNSTKKRQKRKNVGVGKEKCLEKRGRSRENFFILQQKLRQCLFVRSFVCLFACLFVRLFASLLVCLSLFARLRLTLFWQFRVDKTFHSQAAPENA